MTEDALDREPDAETVTVPAAFLRRVISDIATQPLLFPPLLERHNQLCDELGIPEEKCVLGGSRVPAAADMALARDLAIPKVFPLRFIRGPQNKRTATGGAAAPKSPPGPRGHAPKGAPTAPRRKPKRA